MTESSNADASFAKEIKHWFTADPWYAPVRECHEKLKAIDPDYTVLQIKSKFGGLRYYFTPSDPLLYPEMNAIVDIAERTIDRLEERRQKP